METREPHEISIQAPLPEVTDRREKSFAEYIHDLAVETSIIEDSQANEDADWKALEPETADLQRMRAANEWKSARRIFEYDYAPKEQEEV